MALAIVGVIAGVAASFALARFVASFLYGVEQWDPAVFVATPVALTLIALVATWIPARRINAWVSLRCSGRTTVTTSPEFPARAVRPDR